MAMLIRLNYLNVPKIAITTSQLECTNFIEGLGQNVLSGWSAG